MNIFFCEKCGRRVTDEELPPASPDDPDRKSVLCKSCAPAPAAQAPAHPRPRTASGRHTGSHPPVHTPAHGAPIGAVARASAERTKPAAAGRYGLAIGLGVFMLVLGLILLVVAMTGLTRKSEPNKAGSPGTPAPTKPAPPVVKAHPSVANPAVPTPVGPGTPPRSREELAGDAFAALEKAGGETADRIQRLEQFLKEYDDTIVAARARVLLNDLKAPPAVAANPVQTPPPPPPPTTAPAVSNNEPSADGYKSTRVCRFDKDAERWEGDYGCRMELGTFEGESCVRSNASSRGCWLCAKGAFDAQGMRFRFRYFLKGGTDLLVRFCREGLRKDAVIKNATQQQWTWVTEIGRAHV
jgi:hypothetical protein